MDVTTKNVTKNKNKEEEGNLFILRCNNLLFNWKSEACTLPKLTYLPRVRPSAQPKNLLFNWKKRSLAFA